MKKKQKMAIYVVMTVLLIALLFWVLKMEHRRRENIKLTGVETAGTVINKSTGGSINGGATHYIEFEFEHNDKKIIVHDGLIDGWSYDNAIIGKKYKVKYLPDAPKNALIFIGEPSERERNKIKMGNIIAVSIVVLLVASLLWFGKKERERLNNIKQTGTEAIGTVINKEIIGGYTPSYMVQFEFEHNGEKIAIRQQIWNRKQYKKTVIGMKYKVKYLPENPKNGNAIIFLNQPVDQKFENVEKEEERISRTYE